MKVSPVIGNNIFYKKPSVGNNNSAVVSGNTNSAGFSIYNNPGSLSFLGYYVHIFDGGNHGAGIEHFAKAIGDDMDVLLHPVETNPKYPADKQMESLYKELKKMPDKIGNKDEYIAIPALCTVSLQNLQDQYKRVMGEDICLCPENIKDNKGSLIEFLKKICYNSGQYRKYIGYMDPNGQGIEYMYKVIREINRLVQNGYKVYTPTGHPTHESIKWLADERDKKPELQYYLSSGIDVNNSVRDIKDYIKEQGWYNFNLLALSDANIVNMLDAEENELLYSAFDSTVTEGARGTYNFCPVRDKDGTVKGYSYTDASTVQYPYADFYENEKVNGLLDFVGKNIEDCIATDDEVSQFLEMSETSPDEAKEAFAGKLFNIYDIFSTATVQENRLWMKGKYVDSSLRLFFDTNSDNEIIFQNCNCERSERPSVMSMWGSCFAVFNAINRRIENKAQTDKLLNTDQIKQKVEELANTADWAMSEGNTESANYAIRCNREALELYNLYGLDDEELYKRIKKYG